MKNKKIIAGLSALLMLIPTITINQTANAKEVKSPSITQSVKGDVNGDSSFNLSDMVMFRRWLQGKASLANNITGDVNGDEKLDIFDYIAMRKMLINCIQSEENSLSKGTVNLCQGINESNIAETSLDDDYILGQTKLTLELMKNEVKANQNTLISPSSIIQALAMCANGADGQTKAEMENVLGGMDIDELNKCLYTQWYSNNDEENEKCKVTTANSIWMKNGRIQASPEFVQKNIDYYKSEIFTSPFDTTTVDDINNWVNEKTNKMIPSVISEISRDMVMFLINAVSFDAKWVEPFSEYQVKEGKFTASDGTVQTVDMMSNEENIYIKDDYATGFIKYYSGYKYAFAALLPEEGMTIEDYIDTLTPESFNKMLANCTDTTVDIQMPKFTTSYSTELKNSLSEIGMPTAFSKNADFSKMTENLMPLQIDDIIHKARIEVSEDGTKAAAVTVIKVVETCVKSDRKSVTLDRPFVYCIVDTETLLPLFIGTLNKIEQE